MSTHNLCFRAKIRKKCLPLYTPVSLYTVKVGCKGVFITRICLHETRWKNEGVKQIVGKDSRYKLQPSVEENGL